LKRILAERLLDSQRFSKTIIKILRMTTSGE
jgi:hypothetical protein